jgi:hypothetical protein
VRLRTRGARRRALKFRCQAGELFEIFDLVMLVDFALNSSARIECLGQSLQAWEGSHEMHFVLTMDKTSTPELLRLCNWASRTLNLDGRGCCRLAG